MVNEQAEAVVITQADREAAADIVLIREPDGVLASMIRSGEADHAQTVQTVARHRLAERERCANIAERQRAEDWFEVGKVVVATGKRIATTIRKDETHANG